MFREILEFWSRADLLKQSFQTASEMLGMTREMYEQVVRVSITHEPPAFDVHKRDKELNQMEKEIRRKVLEHLSLNPKQDIVASLVLVTVVSDIERIGDYSKNIEELQHLYPEDFSKTGQIDVIRLCSEKVLSFFDLTREAFEQADQEKAQQVMTGHREVRRQTDEVIERVFDDPTVDKKEAVVSVLFARYLKRISAHLKNISTSVVKPFDEIGYTKPPKESPE